MMYLKPLIKKIINGESSAKEIGIKANQLTNDRELLNYLSTAVSMDKIEAVFTHHYGIEYKNLKNFSIDKKIINNFDLNFLKKEIIIPLSYDENKAEYHFAISNLVDRDFRERIKKLFRAKSQSVVFYFAFEHEILDKLEELESSAVSHNIESDYDTKNFNATDWVNKMIRTGIELRASDIHLERLREEIQVRYRVDGLLVNKKKFKLDSSAVSSIYVRLKIISNLDIVESRKSQDGRIDNYAHGGELYDLRVATVNTIYGEKFVLRLLKKDDEVISFDALGFTEENKNKVIKMLNNKNGIIYLAGATGSGKTTTLYTMIEEIKDDSVNIYTIENPVEKTIENVNQIQIDDASGTDYPTILSALLRQDPNVIVVGEIRDAQTAELSIRASLTGHLVMSTIHANSALDSLSRLTDMGVESYLIGASSVGMLSQRLVRKLCPKCKVRREQLKEHEEIWIRERMPDFDYSIEKEKGNYIYESAGCDECSHGYKGRVAAVEVLLIDDCLRTMISKKEDMGEINKYITANGYKTLKYDGIIKALNGITSMDELIGQL